MKIIRAVTVAQSVGFFTGLIPELMAEGHEVVSVSSDGPELDRVRAAGARAVTVEMARQISPFNDLKSLWRLVRVFRREKPDMVHSMTPQAGLLCMTAAWLARVPVRVHTFTGLVFPTSTGMKRRILMTTDRLTCAFATHVIPEGEGVKSDLLNHDITSKPLRVLGHGNVRGIDLAHYDPKLYEVEKATSGLRRSGVFTFIFIGRIVRDKGINELAEAFSRLNRSHPATRLILVGREEAAIDPISSEARHIIDGCPAIEAVGPQDDVRPWLAAADALVFPSYREGFPNVVIEAGAMGLPSIVTDINGSREIIIDGRNGIVIPPRDPEALHGAMESFVENPEAAAAMGAAARQLVASRYEQGYVRRCIKEYYRNILK